MTHFDPKPWRQTAYVFTGGIAVWLALVGSLAVYG